MLTPLLSCRIVSMSSDTSTIRNIRRLAKRYSSKSDEELRELGLALKYKAMVGAKLDALIPEAFTLATLTAERTLGMKPYDCQLFGGIQIAGGHIAEMKTGEGKTLTATLPAYLHALFGKGCHVVTVNDYLAARDLELMGPVYHALGLSTGVVTADMSPPARRAAYRKDVTYGTAKELGFDFLRDRMKIAGSAGQTAGSDDLVQRELNFVLVDEADSILIDEARTPLIVGIINAEDEELKQACFKWASSHALMFEEDKHFQYEHDKKKVTLTNSGVDQLRALPQNSFTIRVPIAHLYKYIENAIKVRRDFHLDQHYAVIDDKIVIVDEFTGRPAEGRQWQGGIHQSVEAKEGIGITPATGQGAMVTLQSFFRLYRFFGGMSGTVWDSRREFKKVYQKKVVRIPTHKPTKRTQYPVKVYSSIDAKMRAVVEEVQQQTRAGRAVLVGTRNIDRSMQLSSLMKELEIAHEVLNANQLSREAEIIKLSGRAGAVTVATNMAGRGTDFLLEDSVRVAGGLHVILTEIHEAARIDWQLIGRGARQGMPGSYRMFVSLEDELLRMGLGPEKAMKLVGRYRGKERQLPRFTFKWFLSAQKKLEKKHLVDRMILLKQDQQRHEQHFEMGQDPYCDVVQS